MKLSGKEKKIFFFFFMRASDFKVLLKVTTAGLVHGTSGAVIHCASSHWHARTDGQTHTNTVPAANPLPPLPPPTTPLPLRTLEVLPVFKSSLRPLSVDKSDGWRGTAAGQPHTDESLGITVRLCQEFGAGQDLFCSVRAAGLVTKMLESI